MYTNPWDPIAQAISDFHNGNQAASIIIFSDFEDPVELRASYFFREPDEFPKLECTALSLCKGKVLDIGAGAGCHSLALQELGFDVTAIDIAPKCVEVMLKRGIRNAFTADILSFSDGAFDTLLMLMNGIGIVGNLAGLSQFLAHARTLLNPDGILIFDSLDLRLTCSDSELAARQADESRDYSGVVRYRVEYRGVKGPEYDWLYVDTDTLTEIAGNTGWMVDGFYPDENGRYLAQLSLASTHDAE